MFIGYTHDNEERHLVEFDDGCTRDAVGIDRADAEAKAQADHEDCDVHTEACRFLNQMVGQALALTVHCNGECSLTDQQVAELLSPPCMEYSQAGRRQEAGAVR
jgi:hypothetical protein